MGRWSLGRWSLMGLVALAACVPQPTGSLVHEHLTGAGFSGSVLVVRGGVEVLRAGYGFADAELLVPNQPDLIYRIGSLTKPITASAVLHAAGEGSLGVADPVCDHIPNCPVEWTSVEVGHLLSHTSGIPDFFGNLPEAPLLETEAEVDQLLLELGPAPLIAPAGAEYAYSNFNYVLLGYVLRSATGEDWESYLRSKVLEPVGASDTRYDDVWSVVPRRARGYAREDGELRHIEYGDHSAHAAGGLRSTVDDLRRWHEALRSGLILDAAQLEEAMTPHGGGYGYGWQIIRALDRELQNHTGGIDGFVSHLAWYPADELLIILLSNVEGTPVKALACDLARLVLDVSPPPMTSPEWLGTDTPERCMQEAL